MSFWLAHPPKPITASPLRCCGHGIELGYRCESCADLRGDSVAVEIADPRLPQRACATCGHRGAHDMISCLRRYQAGYRP